MADTGVAVIGGGVVGLAVAARLAPRAEVVILERRARHGQETSSRNSEVIHGGMYYPEGSLKARLCVDGNRRLYELCARYDVPHARVGKIITAVTPEEVPALDALRRLRRRRCRRQQDHESEEGEPAAEDHGLDSMRGYRAFL